MDQLQANTPLQLTKDPEPYWIASKPDIGYPALEQDISVDVAIVGGGLVGITAAYLLKKAGLKVAVIEADRIGLGTTGHTTAKITSQHGLIYDSIKQQLGEELARQYADANQTAIETMEQLITEHKIDCDFTRRSAYVYTQSDQYIDQISAEAKTAAGLGIPAHYLKETPLPFPVKAALKFDNQAQFHPLKYLFELAKTIPKHGSYIFEHRRAIDIEEGHINKVLTNSGNTVSAPKIIIASHFPFYDGLGFYFSRLYQERSHVLGIKIDGAFPDGMYINAENPTRSLRSQKYGDDELVLVGGERYKTGQDQNVMRHYERLRDFAQETFSVEKILYRWSTQDCTTLDNIPYVGHLTSKTPNLYVATGFGKWGMSNSTVSAMILKDLIINGKSPWQEVYNPSRSNVIAAAPEFVKQNFNVAVHLVSGKLAPVGAVKEVHSGEGTVARLDGSRVGEYRDDENNLHIVDTTCTHMGCEANWNDAEKSWDCPCHGSRFSFKGDVINGPAHNPLNNPSVGRNDIDPNIFRNHQNEHSHP